MIIESIALMTLFDLLMIVLASIAVFNYFRYFQEIKELKYVGAVGMIVTGVVVMSLTYILDFLSMHVFPIFMSFEESDKIMNHLYMDWNWWITAAGVGLIVAGTAYLSRCLVPHTEQLLSELNKQKTTLDKSIEEQKILETELRTLKDQLEEKNIAKSAELGKLNRQKEELQTEIENLKSQLKNDTDSKKNRAR